MYFSKSTCPDAKVSRWQVLGLQSQDYWEDNLQQPEQRMTSLWSQIHTEPAIEDWLQLTPRSLVAWFCRIKTARLPFLPLPESNRSPTGGKKRDFSPCLIPEKQEVTQKMREHKASPPRRASLTAPVQTVTVQSQMTWTAFFFFFQRGFIRWHDWSFTSHLEVS